MPPATGHMAPSSAWTSASSRIATAPMPQEMIAAGPAVASAPCAPNSQPEPMIEPPDAHSSPMKPISRRNPRPPARGAGARRTFAVSTAIPAACARCGAGGIAQSEDAQDEAGLVRSKDAGRFASVGSMKSFNLYATDLAGEPIMFSRPGHTLDYWEGED